MAGVDMKHLSLGYRTCIAWVVDLASPYATAILRATTPLKNRRLCSLMKLIYIYILNGNDHYHLSDRDVYAGAIHCHCP